MTMPRNNKPNEATLNKTNEDVWIPLINTETSPRRNPNPIKYNKDLLHERGILALSYRTDKETLNSLANNESVTLGNRNLKLYQGNATKKQKELLDWLANTNNKNITFNPNVFFRNTQRREEVFFPVAIDREVNLDKLRHFISDVCGITKKQDEIDQQITQQALENSTSSFYLHPWTSDNHTPNPQFPSFKKLVTAVCMFGSYFKGEDVNLDNKKPIIKHYIKFTGDEIISGVNYEIETENPYQEIVFRDFEKQLKFIDASSSSSNKIHLICHLPYVDYMLFGIKLFLHGRMTLNALHNFINIINNEKEHYEERLNSLVKKLQLEDKIELKIQSPFTPLLNILKIDTPDSLAESLLKLGVQAPLNYLINTDSPELLANRLRLLGLNIQKLGDQPLAVSKKGTIRIPLDDLTNTNSRDLLKERFTYLGLNINDTEFTLEEERKAKGIQQETSLVNACLKYLQNNNNVDQWVWRDLVSFNEGFNKTKPSHNESPIENLFALGNIFLLAQATYTEDPYNVCSFLPITEKQIQNMYVAFQKYKDNRHYYGSIFNINYLDTTLTYNETQQHNANQCDTNTKGLAFYFNYPHSKHLYEVICKYLPQAKDPLYKLAKEGIASVKTQGLQTKNYANAIQKNPCLMFNNMSKTKTETNGHLVTGFKPERKEASVPIQRF